MDSTTAINHLFSSLTLAQTQQAAVAQYSLANAKKLMQSGKYSEAIAQLKRTIAMDPTSQDAYNQLGSIYLRQNRTKEAIAVYKTLISAAHSSADAYNSLGNAYLQDGNKLEAEKQYKAAARIDPSSTYAPYTLGNLYLQQGRFAEAQSQFSRVIATAPKDAHGYYGLAMVYNKQGRYQEAVAQADRAIALDRKFAEPYFERGMAHLGAGDKDAAAADLRALKPLDATLASDLGKMLSAPKILASLPSATTFNSAKGAGTLLSSLDPGFLTAYAKKEFHLTFQFDSRMDAASVMNVANWSISKACGGKSGFYNNGVTPGGSMQAVVPSLPARVVYDPEKMQATVFFSLSQNAACSAELDPSHLVFKFSGVDENGKSMDPDSDEFDGFAALPF